MTAEAAGDVPFPDLGLQQHAGPAQEGVPGVEAQFIVDLLEPVDRGHDHHQRPLGARHAPQFQFERFLHEAAVEEPGQGVADRLVAQGLVQAQVRQRHGDALPHGGGEPLLRLRQRAPVVVAQVQHPHRLALGHHRDAEVAARGRGPQVLAQQADPGVLHPVHPPPAQGPAFIRGEGGLQPRAIPPHGDRFHDVAQRAQHVERPRRLREDLLRDAHDHLVDLLGGEAGAQDVPHLAEQGHLAGALLQVPDPGLELAVGFAERLLGPLAFADVPGDPLDPVGPPLAEDEAVAHLEGEAGAPLGEHVEFGRHRNRVGDLAVDHPAGGGPALGGHQLAEAHLQGFVPRITQNPLRRLVDRGDFAREVVGVDHVVGVFEQLPVALLAHAPGLLGQRPLGHVAHDGQPADHPLLPGALDGAVVPLEPDAPAPRNGVALLLRNALPPLERRGDMLILPQLLQEGAGQERGAAQDLLRGEAEHPFHRGVPDYQEAVAVEGDDTVDAAVDEPFQEPLFRLEHPGSVLAVARVLHHEQASPGPRRGGGGDGEPGPEVLPPFGHQRPLGLHRPGHPAGHLGDEPRHETRLPAEPLDGEGAEFPFVIAAHETKRPVAPGQAAGGVHQGHPERGILQDFGGEGGGGAGGLGGAGGRAESEAVQMRDLLAQRLQLLGQVALRRVFWIHLFSCPARDRVPGTQMFLYERLMIPGTAIWLSLGGSGIFRQIATPGFPVCHLLSVCIY